MIESDVGPAILKPDLARLDHPLVAAFVSRIDRLLRHHYGVSEFSASASCILRMQVTQMTEDLTLADGIALQTRDRIIDIHLWNEQVPKMPSDGPTLAWARRFTEAFDFSLRELARYISAEPGLQDVKAIRAIMSIGSAVQRNQLCRIVGRAGFQAISASDLPSLRERLHRFGENVLYAMMLYGCNSAALRSDVLRRARTVAYLSRPALLQRYASCIPPHFPPP